MKKWITNHDVYITTQEFNKLTPENLTEGLKQAQLANKNDDFAKQKDFDNKLKNINKKVTSSKIKQIEVEKKLNDLFKETKLINKRLKLFLRQNVFYGRWWFTKYVYLSAHSDMLQWQKYKGTDTDIIFLVRFT